MRKVLFVTSITLMLAACTKNDVENKENLNPVQEGIALKRECGAMEVLKAQMANDPSLEKRMNDIEKFTQEYIKKPDNQKLVNGQIVIPVVVNVLYKTAVENISDAQIQSQIDVLNEDFNGTNPDYNNVPALFSGAKASVGIKFELAQVIRKASTKKSWSTNDDMKRTAKGGIDPTSPATNLNMWVVNRMTQGGRTILGYAQFPGGSLATDGVVIAYNFFGRTGTVSAPYHKGRTATHEVGHWVNLRHIWGDATCGSDLVDDTPSHNTANYGCPTYPHLSTCTGKPAEMTMNYMDYTDDACMYMFSNGQKSRLLAVFSNGGPRSAFAQ